MERVGSCNRCGRCCGDDRPPDEGGGWCKWLIGRPPGPTTCSHPKYPDLYGVEGTCNQSKDFPDDPNIALPEGCGYKWIEVDE